MSKKAVEKQIRVMVFGTFDGLHPGHASFFKQARNLAPGCFLIASIARDRNVFRIKGKYPNLTDKKRKILVQKSKLADKVVLAGRTKYLPHILKERPDIIALGYDQKSYVHNLKKDFKKRGILIKIARLRAYKSNIYKTHLLRKKSRI